MYRLIAIGFLTSLAAATCTAQISFQGLTPGVSTREDVEKALGTERGSEWDGATGIYAPPAGLKQVKVDYGEVQLDQIVDAIHVQLEKPVSRAALVRKFNLPDKSDSQAYTSDGNLRELFGGDALVWLDYAGHDPSSGIVWIVYRSRRDYEFQCKEHPIYKCGPSTSSALPAMPELPGYMRGGSGSSTVTTGRGENLVSGFLMEYEHALNGTNLTFYAKPQMEDCRDDCARNPNCQGFTWIAAGTYNPNDAAMCYLIRIVTTSNAARGHTSGRKP